MPHEGKEGGGEMNVSQRKKPGGGGGGGRKKKGLCASGQGEGEKK